MRLTCVPSRAAVPCYRTNREPSPQADPYWDQPGPYWPVPGEGVPQFCFSDGDTGREMGRCGTKLNVWRSQDPLLGLGSGKGLCTPPRRASSAALLGAKWFGGGRREDGGQKTLEGAGWRMEKVGLKMDNRGWMMENCG